jgi:sulfotransferase
MKQFHFIIGLPRSGSTVLGALLRQNQNVYVTSTSPMLDQLVANQDIYKYKLSSTKANYIQEQLDNITLNMIQGMWKHVPEKIIIDSNRGWGKNLPSIEILFKQKIKCIGLHRNIPEVMASWLKLIKNNTNNYVDIELMQQGLELTDKNRMMFMWENMVKDCVEALIYAVRDDKENVLLIDYNELCDEPREVLAKINGYLGLPIIEYDLDNININSIIQNDELSWGLAGMHAIREKLEKVCDTALEVLGDELFEYFTIIDNQFKEEINGK